MSGLRTDYNTEINILQNNCKILREIDPNNKHLQLIVFDESGEPLVKSEFWEKYGPKDKKTPRYGLHAIREANKQLGKAIKKAEEKGLVSKVN